MIKNSHTRQLALRELARRQYIKAANFEQKVPNADKSLRYGEDPYGDMPPAMNPRIESLEKGLIGPVPGAEDMPPMTGSYSWKAPNQSFWDKAVGHVGKNRTAYGIGAGAVGSAALAALLVQAIRRKKGKGVPARA